MYFWKNNVCGRCFDAMTSDRPYRKGMQVETAMKS